MAKVIARGYHVVATDLVGREGGRFPVVCGVDALHAPLPTGVRTIITNPPYRRDLLPQLVAHWLGLLEPIGGQLCLLLNARWAEASAART